MVNEISINSINEFISIVMEENKKYAELGYTTLFRGQDNSNDVLMPRLGRYIYKNSDEVKEVENYLVEEFERMGQNYLDVLYDNNENSKKWNLLALAQHHSMVTRLLDWTGNPLVALYFACNTYVDTDRAVWMLALKQTDIADKANNDPFNIKATKAFKPNFIDKRIVAQNGWFTAHAIIDKDPYVLAVDKNPRFNSRLHKFNFPNNIACEIVENLRLLGIHNYSLFPDIDGLCRYLVDVSYTNV